MDPQAGPSSQKTTGIKPAGPGVPHFVSTPLPLKVQVVLYFSNFAHEDFQICKLVESKTGRENPAMKGNFDCDDAEQYRIINEAKSEFKKNKWKWTTENIGRYIASGLTQDSELNLATGYAEEASGLASFAKPLNQSALDKLAKKELYNFMKKRVEENRVQFPEETKIRDQLGNSKKT